LPIGIRSFDVEDAEGYLLQPRSHRTPIESAFPNSVPRRTGSASVPIPPRSRVMATNRPAALACFPGVEQLLPCVTLPP
jgi:hypothetical protein